MLRFKASHQIDHLAVLRAAGALPITIFLPLLFSKGGGSATAGRAAKPSSAASSGDATAVTPHKTLNYVDPPIVVIHRVASGWSVEVVVPRQGLTADSFVKDAHTYALYENSGHVRRVSFLRQLIVQAAVLSDLIIRMATVLAVVSTMAIWLFL